MSRDQDVRAAHSWRSKGAAWALALLGVVACNTGVFGDGFEDEVLCEEANSLCSSYTTTTLDCSLSYDRCLAECVVSYDSCDAAYSTGLRECVSACTSTSSSTSGSGATSGSGVTSGGGCDFRCADGECIPQSSVCDRSTDCSDGADERGCDRQGTR